MVLFIVFVSCLKLSMFLVYYNQNEKSSIFHNMLLCLQNQNVSCNESNSSFVKSFISFPFGIIYSVIILSFFKASFILFLPLSPAASGSRPSIYFLHGNFLSWSICCFVDVPFKATAYFPYTQQVRQFIMDSHIITSFGYGSIFDNS